jgi:hypothetical protein
MQLTHLLPDATEYSTPSMPKTISSLREDLLANERLSRCPGVCPDGTFNVLA